MALVAGKPHHDFGACIACAACAVSCEPRAIEIIIDEDEGVLIWTLDFELCTSCGACHEVCPTDAMGILPGVNPADEAEPPKRCVYALAECEVCGRYYASSKEVDYANEILAQLDHADAAIALAMTTICPDCKRVHDAEAAQRRSNMRRSR
ncbi:MAG: 4Fe-4S dicluster domain-containing protein [Raoultibacter sp.]